MKTFWQHRNGQIYALRHDAFGHIIGVAGPLGWEDAQDLDALRYDARQAEWAESEIRRHAMHRMQPATVG